MAEVLEYREKITGLTPGSTHTYKFAWATGNTSAPVSIITGLVLASPPLSYPGVIMEVFALP